MRRSDTRVWLYSHDAHATLNQSFIYQPIYSTLMAGLVALGYHPQHRIVRQQGGGAARLDMLSVARCGDVLIFIGETLGYADCVPWTELRILGVRTIFYNTEPRNVGNNPEGRGKDGCWWPPSVDVDEVWDYALSNVAAARRCGAGWLQHTLHRHVPPGFDPPRLSARRAANGRATPIFFGNPRSRRPGCLEPLMTPPLGTLAVRAVRSDAALARLLETAVLVLNLHKDAAYGTMHRNLSRTAGAACAQPEMPLEAVRVAQLLSAGPVLPTIEPPATSPPRLPKQNEAARARACSL